MASHLQVFEPKPNWRRQKVRTPREFIREALINMSAYGGDSSLRPLFVRQLFLICQKLIDQEWEVAAVIANNAK